MSDIKVGIHNCFDFVRRDARTGEVLGEYKAENILLNNFWDKYLSYLTSDCLRYIHFGTGTIAPQVTDVKLTSWLGYRSAPMGGANGMVYDYSRYETEGIASVKKTIRLEDTDYNGSYISEVGYSSVTSSTSGLLTKALVKDMNGNVVAIEKKPGEVLDIFATFYAYIGTEFNGSDGIKQPPLGAPIIKAFLAAGSFDSLFYYEKDCLEDQLILNQYSGTYSVQAPATQTYDITNRKIIFSINNLTAATGNFVGGIRTLYQRFGYAIKLPRTEIPQPAIVKEVIGTGDGTTKDFQTKFGWIKNNGTFKVYVNDAETSATADFNIPHPTYQPIHGLKVVEINGAYKPISLQDNYGLSLQFKGPKDSFIIFENVYHDIAPITGVGGTSQRCYGSNDLISWSNNLGWNIAAPYYRYLKFTSTTPNDTTVININDIVSTVLSDRKNIHFDTPPAAGSTIAVTYQPDCIAKDDKHVLNNVKVTLSFNEYTP